MSSILSKIIDKAEDRAGFNLLMSSWEWLTPDLAQEYEDSLTRHLMAVKALRERSERSS